MRVRLPPRLAGDPYALLKSLAEIERASGPVVIDASACERFEPLGTALFGLAIARRVAEGKEVPGLIWPLDEAAQEHLHEIGFERFVEGGGAGLSGGAQRGTLEMRQMTALDPQFIHDVAELLAERVPGTTDDVSFSIELCLKELLQNVFEWAYDTDTMKKQLGCFVACRWYRKMSNVKIAVVDGGVGIPARLRRGKIQDLHRQDDGAVIIAAVTQQGLTSRSGRQGGLGLKTIREIVTARDGSLAVVSQGGRVTFGPGDLVKRARVPGFRGTAIEIDFRPGKTVPSAIEEVF